MRRDRRDADDQELGRSVRDLADVFEVGAEPEERVIATLESRMRRRAMTGVLAAAAVALVLIVLVVAGRGLLEPSVGEPVPMPDMVGIFVTQEPGDGGRCFAVRLYDSTPTDGRTALWTWTAQETCAARSDNLSTGLGRAQGIRLPATGDAGIPAGAGIVIEAADEVAPPLAGLRLILDPREGGDAALAYERVEQVATGTDGVRMMRVDRLDVPYRPD